MLTHIKRLSAVKDRQSFDCGNADLNDYFAKRAGQDEKRSLSSVYALVSDDLIVIGYYSLCQSSVCPKELPVGVSKRLPSEREVPCTLLGRLAVDLRFRGLGYGSLILAFALNDAFAVSRKIAAFAVTVDAKDGSAASFYERHGFERFSKSSLRMFMRMKEVSSTLR